MGKGSNAGVSGIFSMNANTRGAWSGATAYNIGDVVTNAGVTYQALVANTNVVTTSATTWLSLGSGKQFIGTVYDWSRSWKVPQRSRAGRGGPRLEQTRRLNSGSNISFRISGTGVGFPAPANIINSLGGVVLQYDTGKTVTFTGTIIDYDESFHGSKRTDAPGSSGENWDIAVAMNLTLDPVYAGWPNTQNNAPAENFLDQETDAGLSKFVDPNGIATRQTREWDVGTIGDYASAETLKVQHFLTSAALMSAYKQTVGLASSFVALVPRTGTFNRTDRAGGVVKIEYGTTTTKQDVTFPRTRRQVDPFNIENMATSGEVVPGTIPSVSALLTSTVRDYQQLNGNLYIRNTHFETFNTYEKTIVSNSYSTRNASEFNDVFGQIITSPITESAGTAADAAFTYWQNFTNFEDLKVTYLTADLKLLVVHLKEVGTLVRFQAGDPTGRYLPAITNSGNIQVYLPEVLRIPGTSGGLKTVRHQSVFYKTRQRMRFTLSWWVTAPPPIEIYLSLAGTVNNATFCGLAAGTVMYLRMVGEANTGLAGNIPQYKTAEFELDQAGFFDYAGFQDEVFQTTANVVRGWNNVSLFTAGEIIVASPSSSDFSVFGA